VKARSAEHPTGRELLTGIQGRSHDDGDRDVAPDRPRPGDAAPR
jgi:hypothetical protein